MLISFSDLWRIFWNDTGDLEAELAKRIQIWRVRWLSPNFCLVFGQKFSQH